MAEIELKFQIPLKMRSQFEQDIQQYAPVRQQLCAQYFDSQDQQLQQHKIALRQRLEDQQWFQTLKAPAKHEFERFELEHQLNAVPQTCDLALYGKHKQARKILKQALGNLEKPLILQFETNVQRDVLNQRFQDSQIEVALDRGEIYCQGQIRDIYEVEFELKNGPLHDLIDFIRPWVERYQLWLDVRSKSERGYALLNAQTGLPVQHQTPLQLDPEDDIHHILQKIIANCLSHLFPNATAIALENYNSDHVHQARVAIRRLRSALKIFQPYHADLPPEWQDQLQDIFQQLGATRDRDALAESLIPQLEAAGSPLLQLPPAPQDQTDIGQLFRTSATVDLILQLLRFSQDESDNQHKSSHKILCKGLSKLHRQVCKDAENYQKLDIESRHRTRKRVKRLRYNVEFLQSLFPEQEVKSYLKALKPLQESLGHYNDLFVAEELFRPYVKKQPKAWFVLGWLEAEQQRLSEQAALQLQKFAETEPFW
jgi:inorganic triphosphatase YgiF